MNADYEKQSLPHGVRIINDGFEAIGQPDGLGAILVNLDRARRLRETLAERGVRVTYLHLLVKATALAATRVPEARRFLQRYTLFQPEAADVGVSVSGKGNYAPVVVVKAADRRSLAEIAETIRTESEKKRSGEDREIARVAWAYRLIPTRWLRTLIIRLLFRLFPVVRQNYGIVQVSILNHLDFMWPLRFATTACIGMSAVAERPMVVGGEVKAALTAYITIGMSHRVLDGVKAAGFLHEIRKILEDPSQMLSGSEAQAEAS